MISKKILATLAAMSVAATMAVSASAAVTNPNTDDADRYVLKLNEMEGFDIKYTDIYGVTFTYTGTPEENQECKGAIAWQGQNAGWKQADFTLDTLENNSFTYISDAPLFPADDLEWAQVLVAQWDGDDQMDMTIDTITLLGKDGKALGTFGDKAEEQKPAEDEQKPTEDEQKPAEEEQKPTDDEQKPTEEETKPSEEEQKPSDENSATGVASGLAFAGIALAGAAVVASKKNK